MKVETENLKNDAINAASTMGGFMAANAITKVVPLQNAMFKSAIPLVIGLGVTLITTNAAAKSAAYGAIAHGTLSLVKSTLMGDNPIGAKVSGNPVIAKIMNFAIPEGLGSTDENYTVAYDPYTEVSEEDYYEAPISLEGINQDTFALEGINQDAFALEGLYTTDSYEQSPY